MEAKNYRIGNYINYVTFSKTERVKVTSELISELDINSGSGSHRLYHPVRLNDDLLKNLGFKYNTKFMVFENGDVYLDSDYKSTPTYTFELNGLETKIKYIHEIQNLFFALTGTELELKQESSACI